MSPNGRKALVIACVGLAIAAASTWALWPSAVPVDMARIERGLMEVTVDEEGVTRIRDVYTVSAPVSGKLLRSPRRVGDTVQAGVTVVAVVEPTAPAFLDARARREAEAAVAAADAAVELSTAQLRQTQSELHFAEADLARALELSRREVISARQLDQAELAVATAEARVASAEADLSVRRRQLESAQAALIGPDTEDGDTGACCMTLRAPIDGTVLAVPHESEQVVSAGTVLIEIGDRADMEVVAELLSSDAVRVEPGSPARIGSWGGGDALSAIVRRVEPAGFTKVSALGIEEQRVRVVLDIEEPAERWASLGHGYRVVVHIVVAREEDALLLPLSALFRQGDAWAVYAVENGTARRRTVELGARNARFASVLAGLEAGEEVVLHPSDRVAEGVRVAPRE